MDGWVVKPPLNGSEGVAYALVLAAIRAAIGFAVDSCKEVRPATMKTRKCRNEGIVNMKEQELK
jgi:hypothetical protein